MEAPIADDFTDDKILALLMGTGENENNWGSRFNTEVIEYLAKAIAGYEAISVAGSSDVTLTAAQAKNAFIKLTGTLTGNISVIVPTSKGGYILWNATDGSFSVTVKTSAGTGINITQNAIATVWCDGTNVVAATGSAVFAATGAAAKLRASGPDANHALDLVPKGTSGVQVNGVPLLRGYLAGLTLSNNGSDATNDIDIAAGVACDGGGTVLMQLSASITKRLDASWAVGTNQGGLDTGAIANGTYHVWLIRRSDTGVVDVLFSTSASSPTMPTNYDQKRRIGSILRESAAIVAFTQVGDEFLRTTPAADVNAVTIGTTALTPTLSVPAGIKVLALLRVGFTSGAGSAGLIISSPDETDSSPSLPHATLVTDGATAVACDCIIRTSTSRTVRARAGVASSTYHIGTKGWIDRRGRDD